MWIIIKYYRFATLAQLAEHLIRNERVVGSNPISGSSNHAVPEKSGAAFLFVKMDMVTFLVTIVKKK